MNRALALALASVTALGPLRTAAAAGAHDGCTVRPSCHLGVSGRAELHGLRDLVSAVPAISDRIKQDPALSDEERLKAAVAESSAVRASVRVNGLCDGIDEETSVARQYPRRGQRSDLHLTVSADAAGKSCGFRSLSALPITGASLKEQLSSLSFDPCCLPENVLKVLAKTSVDPQGFAIGYEVGLSAGVVGGNAGNEVVLVRNGPDSIQIGIVYFEGFTLAASLDGASITDSVLHGKCHGVEDYLGSFRGIFLAGASVTNQGVSGRPWSPEQARTHCDASTVVEGTTMPLLGFQRAHYTKVSDFVEVKGPGISRLLQAMDRASLDASARRIQEALPSVDTAKLASVGSFKFEDYRGKKCAQAAEPAPNAPAAQRPRRGR